MIREGMVLSDRYEIVSKVGAGGMSDVYKAKDHKLNRFVAVKVLKAEFSENRSFVSEIGVGTKRKRMLAQASGKGSPLHSFFGFHPN